MNQTRHEQWAYRGRVPQALINNQRQTIRKRQEQPCCRSESVRGAVCRERTTSAREGQTCFQENSTSRTYRIQERQFLLVLIIEQNQLMSCYKKYLFNRRRFLSREPVCLMMWACPLPRRNRHKRKYVQVLFVFVNQILWENPMFASFMDNEIG